MLLEETVLELQKYRAFFSPFCAKKLICCILWPISLLCLVTSVMFHYFIDIAEHYWYS